MEAARERIQELEEQVGGQSHSILTLSFLPQIETLLSEKDDLLTKVKQEKLRVSRSKLEAENNNVLSQSRQPLRHALCARCSALDKEVRGDLGDLVRLDDVLTTVLRNFEMQSLIFERHD